MKALTHVAVIAADRQCMANVRVVKNPEMYEDQIRHVVKVNDSARCAINETATRQRDIRNEIIGTVQRYRRQNTVCSEATGRSIRVIVEDQNEVRTGPKWKKSSLRS